MKIIKRQKTQQRALVTRESIIEAGLRILRDRGVKEYNTNKVAEVAGISVGSLYQYFPNKKSILKYILLKKIQSDIAELGSLVESIKADGPEEFIQRFLVKAWDSFLMSREMCRELYLAAESYDDHLEIIQARTKLVDMIVFKLHSYMPQKNIHLIKLRTHLITDSFMGVMQSLVFDDELYKSNDILKRDFVNMVKLTFVEPA